MPTTKIRFYFTVSEKWSNNTMPGFFTHYIAGKAVLDKIQNPELKNVLENSNQVYELGLQGPDFFKYFGAPFKADDAVTRITMALRERTVGEWLSTIYRYIKSQAPEDAEILRPYFMGYLVYYRVNCAINPYISYNVGFQTPGADMPERFNVYRNRFTTAMDELVLKKYLGKTPAQMNIKEIFYVDYKYLLEVCRLYPRHLKTILGREISRDETIRAAQNMYELIQKRIKPGFYSISVPIYEQFSKETFKGTYTSARYGKVDPSIDYLNEGKKLWYFPWDNKVAQTASVDELLQKGINEAVELINFVYDGFNGKNTDVQVQTALKNDSMLTGVAWNAPFLPKFYDCVYKRDEEKIAKTLAKLERERLKNE